MSKPKPSWKIRRRGKSWQVDFGVVAGRRLQRSCKSNAEAQQWAQAKDNELKNKRYAALELSDQHRFDALEAYKTLARSLHVAVKSLPSPIVSLNRIAEFYIKHANPEGGQRTVQEVVDEYLQTKIASGRRPRTITDVSSRITRFAQSCSDAPINLITTVDLEKWLNSHKYKGITRKNYRTHLVMFFNFARRRKYVSVNPAEDIETPIVDEKMPEIFTVDECQILMAAAQEHADAMVPYFAIALFAGLRPTEVERLDWRNINFDTKTVKVVPETSKKRRLRYVDMSDNLIKWLRPYRKDQGPVFYQRNQFDRVRRKGKVRWAADILRHSYASYHLARHEDAAKTSLQLGHRDTDVLFNHYRDLVMRKDAEAFWGIEPKKGSGIIRMRALA